MLCLLGLTACVTMTPAQTPVPPTIFGANATSEMIMDDYHGPWIILNWNDGIILLYKPLKHGTFYWEEPLLGVFEVQSESLQTFTVPDVNSIQYVRNSATAGQVLYSTNDQIWQFDIESQKRQFITAGSSFVQADNGEFICVGRESKEIWLVDTSTTEETLLFTLPDEVTSQRGSYVTDLDLSPDFQWLVLGVENKEKEADDIYLINLSTREGKLILSGYITSQAWSPDGKWLIAYQFDPGQPTKLIVMDPFCGCVAETFLTTDFIGGGYWSSDGSTILYSSLWAGETVLHFVNVENLFGKPYTDFECQLENSNPIKLVQP